MCYSHSHASSAAHNCARRGAPHPGLAETKENSVIILLSNRYSKTCKAAWLVGFQYPHHHSHSVNPEWLFGETLYFTLFPVVVFRDLSIFYHVSGVEGIKKVSRETPNARPLTHQKIDHRETNHLPDHSSHPSCPGHWSDLQHRKDNLPDIRQSHTPETSCRSWRKHPEGFRRS